MTANRDLACAQVAAQELLALDPQGPVGVVDEGTGQVADALSSLGCAPVRWHTRAWDGVYAMAEPAEGVWAGALVRLPRERARLEVVLDLCAGRLPQGAPLWVVGANDEGIKSTARRLTPLFEAVETVAARRHCRLLQARRSSAPARGSLVQWQTQRSLALPGAAEPVDVVTVPGVFAKGQLDPATALLLEAAADLSFEGPCLDFACGAGLIALGVDRRHPGLSWTLTDVDAWSVHCARQNLPTARVVLGHGWAPVPHDTQYGAIFSNPPLHRGVAADRTTLDRLIAMAPGRMTPSGQLIIVSQRTAGVGRRLRARFSWARLLREDGWFQVWGARDG